MKYMYKSSLSLLTTKNTLTIILTMSGQLRESQMPQFPLLEEPSLLTMLLKASGCCIRCKQLTLPIGHAVVITLRMVCTNCLTKKLGIKCRAL